MLKLPPTQSGDINPGQSADGSAAVSWADTARNALELRLSALEEERRHVESESMSVGPCGDAADRSAHVEAVIRLEELQLRIAEIELRLQTLEDYDLRSRRRGDTLQIGHTVTVRFDADDECETFVVGMAEQFEPGTPVITPGSPLGEALRGAHPGDHITYRIGAGRHGALTVVSMA
jgi:transcription elongation factor GreA